MMEKIVEELKLHLIKELNLEDIEPKDIENDAPLFGEGGLELDSIDALEIIIIMEKYYGIKLSNSTEAKSIFYSVNTLAEYIVNNRKQ